MSPAIRQPSREDVLGAFAVEPRSDRQTLERYLREFPTFASELVELSRELTRDLCEDEAPLSTEDQRQVDAAWLRHVDAAPKSIADPLASLSAATLRDVAKQLDVPRQVVTAFRERRVIVTSVPRPFLARFAKALNSAIDDLVGALSLQPAPTMARSYKADGKPGANAPVTFEQLLIDAGVPDDRRASLMSDAN